MANVAMHVLQALSVIPIAKAASRTPSTAMDLTYVTDWTTIVTTKSMKTHCRRASSAAKAFVRETDDDSARAAIGSTTVNLDNPSQDQICAIVAIRTATAKSMKTFYRTIRSAVRAFARLWARHVVTMVKSSIRANQVSLKEALTTVAMATQIAMALSMKTALLLDVI